jgi:hypothetical protein
MTSALTFDRNNNIDRQQTNEAIDDRSGCAQLHAERRSGESSPGERSRKKAR